MEKNIPHTEKELLKLEELAREIMNGGRLNNHWTMLNTYAQELHSVSNGILDKSNPKYCGDKERQDLFDEANNKLIEAIQKQHSSK